LIKGKFSVGGGWGRGRGNSGTGPWKREEPEMEKNG